MNSIFKSLLSQIYIKKKYLILLLLNVFLALGSISIYKFIEIKFTDDELFGFTYIKRILAFLSPISLLGSGVTLIRFIGLEKSNINHVYTLLSILLTVFIPFVLIVLNIVNPEFIIDILWSKHANLHFLYFYPLIIYLIGINMTTIVICQFRGLEEYFKSTFINLGFIVLMPFAILYFTESINEYIFYNGLFLIFFTSLIIFKIIIKAKTFKLLKVKSFIYEGITRVFGDVSYYFLILAPSYFVLKFTGDLSMTAAISFCQILINASSILIKPVTLIKLPWTIKLKEQNNINIIKKVYFKEIKMTFFIFLIITLILVGFLEIIIKIIYSASILEYITEIRIYLFLLPFYCCHLLLRNYIDGITVRPINSFVTACGLIIFIFQIYVLDFGSVLKTIIISLINSFIIMDLIIIGYLNRYK